MINEYMFVLECEPIMSMKGDIRHDNIVRTFQIGDVVDLDELNVNDEFARVNTYSWTERARRELDQTRENKYRLAQISRPRVFELGVVVSEALSVNIKKLPAEDVKVLYLRITYELFHEIGQCVLPRWMARKNIFPVSVSLPMFPERVAMHRKKRGRLRSSCAMRIDRKGEKKARETDFLLSLGPAYPSQWFPTMAIIGQAKSRPSCQKQLCEKKKNEIIIN